MKKIYIVIKDWAYEYDQSIEVVGVFYTEEKAKKCLNDLYESEAKIEFDDCEFVDEDKAKEGDYVCYKTDTSIDIFQMGEYTVNHYHCYIIDKEIE